MKTTTTISDPRPSGAPPDGPHPMQRSLRNVALVAHVDHGKTTLVDALLRQTGTFGAHQHMVDRADARGDDVLGEIEQLFIDLVHTSEQLDFPVVSTVAREGRSVAGVGTPSDDDDLTALLDAVLATVPAPTGDPAAPLQALV